MSSATSSATASAPFVNIPAEGLVGFVDNGVRFVDVREPNEFDGPLGHLPTAELVPLSTLPDACESWSREPPILLICRSGARSARAAEFLSSRGFRRLYNLHGGMLAVRAAQGNPSP
jgi:rhodanese-related sulfurtransferase